MKCIKISLTAEDYSNQLHFPIQEAFQKIFTFNLAPKNMAMFTDKELIDSKSIYLVPSDNEAIKAIGMAHHGVECDLPSAGEISLSVGNFDAIEHLAER